MSGIIVGILSSTISLAVILLIAAEGEIFVERSGQFNMGIEGIMISSALTSFVGTYFTNSVTFGILVGAITGAIIGWLLYMFIEKLNINGILVAVVFNLLATGITGFVALRCLNTGNTPLKCKKLTSCAIPILSKIPYIGKIVFNQNIIVYIAFLIVPFLSYYLFKTKSGLEIRAVGEDETASQTMGIDAGFIKMKCFIIGGICAGISGGYISLGMGLFMDGMTANKGFIAMALCAFSSMSPIGTLIGSLLFALADSIEIYLQLFNLGIPYEFMVSLPYILTIAALIIASRKGKLKKKTKIKTVKPNIEILEPEEDGPEYTI